MMVTGKTILALGAGRRRKKLPREHRVVLIDREADYVFAPGELRVHRYGRLATRFMTRPDRLSRPYPAITAAPLAPMDYR